MSAFEFTQHYKKYYPAFYSFALRLTRSHEDALDLVQESGLKAYKYIHSFSPGTNFKSWVNTILKNTFVNKFHKKKKRKVVNQPIEEFMFGYENKNAVANGAGSNIRMKELMHEVNQVDDKFKIPFLMHYKGYQYDEIGRQMNIPIGTVKSRIHYARQKLKARLGNRK